MEKRKVFKISIIDKEISRTEFDRNTFYTSDSELTLVFKLIERDYSYDHGEILLYNENDKSFVTRKIEKQENDFVYEIDSDIIPHYGTWKAQLQLVNEGDVYTSKPFDFSIVNDLSNLAPQPTLTDINNWSTLKKNAAELIDEMRTVIDDIKKAESKHENAERIRQSQENSRVQSENERQSQERLRSQGESQRQSQENKRVQSENERRLKELEREKAENNRKTIFENNEFRRKETFNANEKTRKQAESERQSAELIRVSEEEQRKIDHANRSAELAGKADKVVLKNLVENGDFTTLRNWTGQNSIIVNANNKLTITGDGTLDYPQVFQNRARNYQHKYYIRTVLEKLDTTVIEFRISTSTFSASPIIKKVGADTEYILSDVIEKPGEFLRIYGRYPSGTSEGKSYALSEVLEIDLTESFGSGNEPTKEEMDELIKVTGYIDGEYALNNKEMLIWTIALIRRNRKAIITLGGTI